MKSSLKFLVVNIVVVIILMILAALFSPVTLTPRVYLLAGGCLITANLITAGFAATDFTDTGGWSDSDHAAYIPPDPWEMQHRAMAISGQSIADTPSLTNTSALYGALIMEETGEFYGNLAAAAADYALSIEEGVDHRTTVANLARRLSAMASVSRTNALDIRKLISSLPSFDFPLDEVRAVALLDDHADITVVNCGFAVAAGLPGAAAYNEVTRSNLSKANPDTGAIDKDPSGKWIKGINYFSPDLMQVLRSHCPAVRPMSCDEREVEARYADQHHPGGYTGPGAL